MSLSIEEFEEFQLLSRMAKPRERKLHRHRRTTGLRKKITLVIYEFFLLVLNASSAHGLGHIAAKNRHPLEIVIWVVSVVFGIIGAAYLCLSTWQRYQSSPTVISLERNYLDWNTSFPACTLCPLKKGEGSELARLAEQLLTNSEEYNGTQRLQLLANATYHTFGEVEDLINLNPNNYLDIILEAPFNFSYSLSNSNSEISILRPIMTEMGLCYSYNSQVSVYNSPSYWKENSWKMLPLGRVFKGNPLEGDMFAAMMEMNSDSQVFIHSPQEVPESASRWFLLAEQNYLTIEFEALTTYSTDDTRRLSIKQRKCRFLEESNLKNSPVYSYNLCRAECRMRLAFKLCGCIPHLYRNNGKYRICNVSGMHCLSTYKERLVKLRDSKGNKHKCDCYPTCNDINYIIQADTSLEWLLGTNFKYTLIKYPRSRLKRDVVFGASDLLVQLGGTVGLCLGCSILTIAEIFYFFTLRLFLFILAKCQT